MLHAVLEADLMLLQQTAWAIACMAGVWLTVQSVLSRL